MRPALATTKEQVTSDRSRRRVRFVQADLQRLSSAVCMARVELERPESGGYVGTAVAPEADGLRAAAKAAADALMQAVGDEQILEIQGVKLINAFGQLAVVVHLGARHRQDWQSLMGLCVAGENLPRAAALAVLNATNRVLNVG